MKKRSKSLLSLILVFALVFTMVVPAAAKTSGDVYATDEGDQQMLASDNTGIDGGYIDPEKGSYKYVAIGDSTAAGFSIDDAESDTSIGLEAWENYQSSVPESYPYQFADKLCKELKNEGIINEDSDFTWSNLGISSYQMYDYYRVLIDPTHTSVLFNNMLSYGGQNPEQAKANNAAKGKKISDAVAAIKALKPGDSIDPASEVGKTLNSWWTSRRNTPAEQVAKFVLNYYDGGQGSLYTIYGIKFEQNEEPWFNSIKDLKPEDGDYNQKLTAALKEFVYNNKADKNGGYTDEFTNAFRNKCYLAMSDKLLRDVFGKIEYGKYASYSYLFHELFMKEIPTADLISLNIGANDLLEQFMFDLVRTSAGKNADTMDGMTVTGVTYERYESVDAAKTALQNGEKVYEMDYNTFQYIPVTDPLKMQRWNQYYKADCAVDNVFMFVTWAALFELMGGQEMSSVLITVTQLLNELLPMRYNGNQDEILADLKETLEYLDSGAVEDHIYDNGVKAMQYYQMVVNMIKRGGIFPNIKKMNQSGVEATDEYGQLYFADKENKANKEMPFDFDKLSFEVKDGKAVYSYDGKLLTEYYLEYCTEELEPLNKDAQIMYVGGFNPFGMDKWNNGTYYNTFNTAVKTLEALFSAYKTETLSAGNLTKANLELADMLVSLVEKSTADLSTGTNTQIDQFLKGALEKSIERTHNVISNLKDLVDRIQSYFVKGGSSAATPEEVTGSILFDPTTGQVAEAMAQAGEPVPVKTRVTTIDKENKPVVGSSGGTINVRSLQTSGSNYNLRFDVVPAAGYFPYNYTAVISYMDSEGKEQTNEVNLLDTSNAGMDSTGNNKHNFTEQFTDKQVNIPINSTDIAIKVVFKATMTWEEMLDYASDETGEKEIYRIIRQQIGPEGLSLDSMGGVVDNLIRAVANEYGPVFKGKNDTELMKAVKVDLIIALLLEQVGFSEDSALELGMTIGLVLDETSYPLMYTLLGKPGIKACEYENDLIKNKYAADPELGGPYVSIVDMPSEDNMNPHPLTANHEYIANQMYDAVINNVNLCVEGEGKVYCPDSKIEGKNAYSVMYNFDAHFIVEPEDGYAVKYSINGGKETVLKDTKEIVVPNVKKDTTLKVVFYKDPAAPELKPAPSVKINRGNISLIKGLTMGLAAITNQAGAVIKWASSNTDIVRVSANGTLQAIKNGVAYITATIEANGKKYFDLIKVEVKDEPEGGVQGITLGKTEVVLAPGYSSCVQATVLPEGSTQTVKWSSDNPSVATVNQSGIITARSIGQANITAKAGAFSVSLKVVVKDAGDIPQVDPTDPTDPVVTGKFVDVPANAYFFEPVEWAAEKNITSGIDATHFGPNLSCTRAHMVTFLWRAMGCPEPASLSSQFTDVVKGSYYEKAVAWAVENGIAKGISDTLFAPNQTVLRGQAVTFLARTAGIADNATGYTHSFKDVFAKDYYNNAVAWAASKGITNGVSKTEFAPKTACTRGQIVSFLYRYIVGA